MLLIRLLRWLRSYVIFSVRSGSLERLINICTNAGIPVWNCRRSGKNTTGCTTVGGYHQMRPLTHKSGISTRVVGRYGARFILYRYRRRAGILAGIAVFATLLIISQQFVWAVRIEGCEKQVDPQRLIVSLNDMGVRRGTLKKTIELNSIARKIQISVNELSWVALNIHGTTAVLKVRERTSPPPKVDIHAPANVIAAQDGQIVRLQVTDGKALLKQGDTVRAGEMIVSGVRQDRWGVTHLVRANASAIAHVPASLLVEIPLEQEQAAPAGRVVRRRYIDVLGMHFPLFLYSELEGSYKLEQFSKPIYLAGKQAPISILNESYIFYNMMPVKLSEQEALRIAQKELARKERKEFSEVKVLSRREAASCEDGVLILRGEYVVERDIAKQVEIGVLERTREVKPEREGGY